MLDAPTDAQYAALAARDARHDGWFFVAVTSTGIYCRPSCPARTPRRENVRVVPTAAAAQAEGFRACLRCRPDASPGSPEWDVRGDVAGRAMRLIGDGVVDRDGVGGLAQRLGYSERQLHRILTAELGVGPIALARAQRAQTARILIETTDLPMARVALAAGFASLRQFNDTVREIFASTPTELRRRRRGSGERAAGSVRLRLPFRGPLDAAALWRFLGRRALPGVETALTSDGLARTLRLPHGQGRVVLRSLPRAEAIDCQLDLEDLRDLQAAVTRCRALLDLDADPIAIDAALAADPRLGPSVVAGPGRRVPGAVDGFELAVRAVLGQQVSVAAARTMAGRIAEMFGDPVRLPAAERSDDEADRAPARVFPAAGTLADADLTTSGLTTARAATIRALAGAIAADDLRLEPGADRTATAAQLLALPGVGPWTVEYVLMRALRDPDRFPASDLVVRQHLGSRAEPVAAAEASRAAEAWRPWRSYALMHLWEPAHAAELPHAGPGAAAAERLTTEPVPTAEHRALEAA